MRKSVKVFYEIEAVPLVQAQLARRSPCREFAKSDREKSTRLRNFLPLKVEGHGRTIRGICLAGRYAEFYRRYNNRRAALR